MHGSDALFDIRCDSDGRWERRDRHRGYWGKWHSIPASELARKVGTAQRVASTWLCHHRESERYAAAAEHSSERCDPITARRLYAPAAEAEERALDGIAPGHHLTRAVTAVSAVALYLKAGEPQRASSLADRCCAFSRIPAWSVLELRALRHAAAELTAKMRRSRH